MNQHEIQRRLAELERMASFDAGDFRVNTLVSGILVGYQPDGFIAPLVCPIVPVNAQQGIYPRVIRHDQFRESDALRAPGTAPNEVGYTVGSGTYFARNYELAGAIPWEVQANAQAPHEPVVQEGQVIRDKLALGYEIRAYNLYNTNVGSSLTRSGDAAWSNFGGSDPAGDLRIAREAIRRSTQKRPNTAIMGASAWEITRRHPDLIRLGKPGTLGGGMLTEEEFASIIFGRAGGGKFLVAEAIKNTSLRPVETDTGGSYGDVWSTHLFLAYVEANPGIMKPSFCYGFNWVGPKIGNGAPGNYAAQTREDGKRKATEMQMGYYQDEQPVDPVLGFRIDTGITG